MTKVIGYCSNYGPPYGGSLNTDFFNTAGWSFRSNSEIAYSGKGGSQDTHFWLWFWKADRWYLQNALIKANYFCDQARLSAEIRLGSATEAGIFFRARGTYDFWAVLATNGGAKLIWVEEGDRNDLLSIPCSAENGYLTIGVQDQIGDVVVTCGGTTLTHKLEDVDEISTQQTGAAGLVAFDGSATFRNAVFGEVQWNPGLGDAPKLSNLQKTVTEDTPLPPSAAMDLFPPLRDRLDAWCPGLALCGKQPFDVLQLPLGT